MNNKIIYYVAFVFGMGLIGAERGWRGITYNIGFAIVLLCIMKWWGE